MEFDVDKVIEVFKRGEIVSEQQYMTLIFKLMEILSMESNCLEIQSPVLICGDIHAQLYDLFELFKKVAPNGIGDKKFLFLGDYVDRGMFSLETFGLLAAYKIKFPQQFYLLRGNHECAQINSMYGFYLECTSAFGHPGIYTFCNEAFSLLPVACLIDNKVFSVHGGLSPHVVLIESISLFDRKVESPE